MNITTRNPIVLDRIANLPAYNAGTPASTFEATYGTPLRAKLDSNENPLGPGPLALGAAARTIAAGHRYPDGSALELRQVLANRLGVSPAQIQVGNGSEELINMLFRAVLSPGDRVVTVVPSFGLHENCGLACGAIVEKIPFAPEWLFPVQALCSALRDAPKICVLSSPSNPVGCYLPSEDLDRILAAVSNDTLFILDEAYVEYLPTDLRQVGLDRLIRHDGNWVSLRTFSKAHGLAGLRVGYAICSSGTLAAAIKKAGTPFNVNAVAMECALAALADEPHLARSVALAEQGRTQLREGLAALGYRVVPSFSNSVFVDVGKDADAIARALRLKGVLVKAWKEPGYTSFLRVSAGNMDENRTFLDELSRLL